MWRLRQRGHSSPGDHLLTALPAEKSVPSSPSASRERPGGGAQQRPGADSGCLCVTFADLGVPAPLVAALGEDGITVPFPIQAATLPDALAGCRHSRAGPDRLGKTLGVLHPARGQAGRGATRWRAARVAWCWCRPASWPPRSRRSSRRWPHAMGLSVAAHLRRYPAEPAGGCLARPRRYRRRLPGTAGRPHRAGPLSPRRCRDQPCSTKRITWPTWGSCRSSGGCSTRPRREGQRLLFSATLDGAVDVLARRFLTQPARHSVDDASPPAQIIHHLLTVTPADRVEVVATLASGDNRVLIFTRTKHGARSSPVS